MEVPFANLSKQYNEFGNEVEIAINRVVKNQNFILGAEGTEFEIEFARYLGDGKVAGVGSGTDALIFSLQALGVGVGDEVITPANSFIASALAITEVGATPVFIDVDPATYLIDVSKIEAKITAKTKAIMPVHLYGAVCDMPAILAIAKRHNLRVIEDACQAHGASLNGRLAGTWGDIAAFSFYPTKNLGAYGDGGAVYTHNLQLHNKICLLRNYGQRIKYYHDTLGRNSRLDEMQAAILKVKLKHLNTENSRRNVVAQWYREMLPSIKCRTIAPDSFSNYHLLTIETDHRNELADYLTKKGISTQIHYPVPIHLQKCYKHLGYSRGDFPVAEDAANRILSLPMHPNLTEGEVSYVSDCINSFV